LAEQETIVKRWLLVLVFALSSTTTLAQPAPDRAAQRREKIKERIRALRAYTLTTELSLDEQTAGKLFPLLAKFDGEFDKLLQQRMDIQRRLVAPSQDAKAIDKLIDEAVANQRALWDTEDKRLAQLRKILTPAQTARVLVVLPAMERKIENQLRRAVQRQQRKLGKPGANAQPVDPYDDDDDGELGGNPFAGPPSPPPQKAKPPAKPPAKQAPPRGQKPCDPFSDLHGCAD
jgi:hypothetical protein